MTDLLYFGKIKFLFSNFKDKSVPIISHSYNTPIETKIFNYKNVLQDLNIYYFKYINLLIAPMQVPFI
jgi:hypothetical protein